MSFGCSYRKVVHNLSTDLFRFCYTSNVMHFFVCVPFPFKLLPKNKWHFLAASRFMMNVLFLFLLPENGIQINQLNWVFCLQRDVHLLNLHKDLISSAFKLFSRFLYIWHCAERKKKTERTISMNGRRYEYDYIRTTHRSIARIDDEV